MGSFIGRRWVFRVAAAVLAALGIAYAILPLWRHDADIARLDSVMAESASGATVEARPLFLEAGQVAHDLLRDFRDDAEALDAVARLYRQFRNSKDAIRCWQRCIELDPSLSATAHAAIASAAFDAGDFEAAAEHYRSAMQQDPASSTYPVSLGEALISQGKPEEAVRVLEEDLKSHPRSMPAAALLGRAYLQLHQYDKARRHLESSVRTSPDYPAAYHGLTTAYAHLGEKEKAQEYRKKFQELQSHRDQRRRQELKTRDDMARVRQEVASTYADAARVYIVRGDAQAGERRLLRARELAPNGSPWLLMLASLYEQQGRLDEALATLADASQRAPQELATQLSIAFAYSRLGSNDKAEDAYRQVIELAPRQGSSYAALAQFYLRVGQKLPEAKNLAQKAVELEPAGEYWFLLSQACLRSGDRNAARRAIEQAVALDPGNDAFRRLRDQLRRQP
jgi:tetratricopeptide (TPR) repeat protein